jgi:predicted unusual protein kinase regulating ubiquinone biosynthesis (AarF/ABC1/UbiB family)
MIFFNLCKCILISTLVKLNIYNDKLLKILIKNIYKCGVIPIKMVQWGLPYMKLINIDNKIINILENTYEKCPVHNINFTNKIYKKDFYSDLENHYEIIDIIGSGSIAQVYKIKSIRSDKLYAMKVKHPNADNDFNIIKLYLKIIFTLFSFNKLIPVNLNEFLNQFEKQLNFINETNNLIRFNNLYKNNNLYKIPKLYKFSQNIIIMDYIPGKSIETIEYNSIDYFKYNLNIFVFSNNNLYINDFNHGDLHNYNWKITEDNKIVIYDFGLCWELKDNKIMNTINILNEGFHNKNNELIYQAFKNYIKCRTDIDDKYIKEYFISCPTEIYSFKDFSYYLIIFCLKYNHLLDIKILYNIISYQHMLLIFMKKWKDDNNYDYNGIYKEEYNICDYYNILPEYKNHLKNRLKNFKSKVNYDNLCKFIK